MENSIVRGQPWSIRLRLKPEQIVVGNIQGIYLAVVQGANKTVKIFADGVSNWTLNSSQNTVTCQLSATNTNTLTAGIRAGISAHITDTSGEKSEVFAGIYAVENQGSTDVLPDILDANIQSGQTIPDSEIDADLRPATFTNNGTYSPSGFDGYSQVTVNVGAPSGTKQISITENGTITENVANYANAAITTNVVNQDYLDSLTALGVTEDLADGIEALTTYANGVTGESDTTLSDAVESLADGYGGGGGVSDGYEITAIDTNGFPTAVDHYGTEVHRQQYWNRTSADGFWRNLVSIAFKDIVTSIGTYAFTNCSNLTLPDLSHITSIGAYAFQGCSAFTAVSVLGLTVLDNFIFNSCANLTDVYLPKCTNCSGQRSFGGCPSLETVQLGSIGYTVTSMHAYTFYQLTQSTLTITVYTEGSYVDTLLSRIRSSTGATNATVIFKASEATTYNETSYSAGDTILTSTPS